MANRAFRNLLGYRRGDLDGRPVSQLMDDRADFDVHWRAVLAGSTREHSTRLRRRDGGTVRARVASIVVSDDSGNPRFVVCRAQAA
jgi:PAS domain S-box-containing protein